MSVTSPTMRLPRSVGIGMRTLGRYEIIAKLASGGMATVYLGRLGGAGGFERQVAVKVLHPHLAEDANICAMFLDEARLAAGIRDPHVVPVIDVGDEGEHGTFLVMEYVEGCDLSALLHAARKRGTRLPLPVALRIVCDLLGGLEAAHGHKDGMGRPLNLVHRDVSPHNLIVGRDGTSRLTDFGIAKAEGRIAQTRTGNLKGKLGYMPPERLLRLRDPASVAVSDHRGDLYAAGVVLWEMLTGRRLFHAPEAFEVVQQVLDGEVDPPSIHRSDAEPLDAVVYRATALDPEARFASAAEMRAALEAVAKEVGGVANVSTVRDELEEICGQQLAAKRTAIDAALLAYEAVDVTAPEARGRRGGLAVFAAVVVVAVAVGAIAVWSAPPSVVPEPEARMEDDPAPVAAPPPRVDPEPVTAPVPEPVAAPVAAPVEAPASSSRMRRRERPRVPAEPEVAPESPAMAPREEIIENPYEF